MKPLLSFAAVLCAAGLLTAAGGCVSRIPAPSNEPTTLFRQMDKDHDGKLSRAEFNAGFADAVFNVYNQDRSGSVTSEQWNRIQNANNPTGQSAFADLDANHDGKLTYAELSGGPRRDPVINRFFDLIDKDRDGSISLDEGRPSGLDRTPQQRAEGEGL